MFSWKSRRKGHKGSDKKENHSGGLLQSPLAARAISRSIVTPLFHFIFVSTASTQTHLVTTQRKKKKERGHIEIADFRQKKKVKG
jgi:hypothetical protein